MKTITDRHFERIDEFFVNEFIEEGLILDGCIINIFDVVSVNFIGKVEIRNCILSEFKILGCWFEGGLSFSHNIVKSPINYEMGGHNKEVFELNGNIFNGFFSFFDCQFDAEERIENNIFMQGSDLLYKEQKGFDNSFTNGLILTNNLGRLDIMECTTCN